MLTTRNARTGVGCARVSRPDLSLERRHQGLGFMRQRVNLSPLADRPRFLIPPEGDGCYEFLTCVLLKSLSVGSKL